MRRANVFAWICTVAAAVLAGCAAGEAQDPSTIECTVDSECPGPDRVCDLLTNQCVTATGGADTGDDGSPKDSGPPGSDAGDSTGGSGDAADAGGGSDSNLTDSSRPDTWSPQDTGGPKMDTGPTFSGCSSDSDCTGYLVCNTSEGRCEDPRSTCSSNSDCGSNQYCAASRCVDDCSSSQTCSEQGLQCVQVASSTYACLAICDDFDGSGTKTCGEDKKCIPFYGSHTGLCRGAGLKTAGETCSEGYGTDACTAGHLCVNNRGDKRCHKLCGRAGAPSCSGSDTYCAEAFTRDVRGNDVQDPAGWCNKNCGGVGNTNNGKCSGSKLCQPDSASTGFCTAQGSVRDGGSCRASSGSYCKVGLACLASSASNAGMCRGICDPGVSASANRCKSGQACVQESSGFGFCMEMCSQPGFPTLACPLNRSYCASTRGVKTTPATSGVCTTPP